MSKSPTQLTLEELRAQGWEADKSEYWNHFARRRKDLFGFADIVALGDYILAVQATSYSNISARRRKILANPMAKKWQEAGGVIKIYGWKKVKNRWTYKEETLNYEAENRCERCGCAISPECDYCGECVCEEDGI